MRVFGAFKNRLFLENGFTLVELLVSLVILSIVLGMSTELYISNLRSTTKIEQRVILSNEADFIKSWLGSNLAIADIPPVSGTWNTLEVTSNGTCFKLSLDNSGNLQSQTASTCATVDEAPPTTLGGQLTNSPSKPLFTYKTKTGEATSDVAQMREIDINLELGNISSTLSRTFSYVLGGIYLANQIRDNSIGTAQLVDGAVTSPKISDGAVTADKLAVGAINASQLPESVRESFFSLPLITGGTANWTTTSTTDWSDDPNKDYDQVSTVLGDYCAAGKTLQSRAHFVIYNKSASTLSLSLKLIRDDGSGGPSNSDYIVSDSFSVNSSAHVNKTTTWQNVGCSTPETLTYFYSTKAKAGDSGSIGQSFSVVYSALELRYQ